MMGHTIEGIAALLERVECPIHLQRDETEWVAKSTGRDRRPLRRSTTPATP